MRTLWPIRPKPPVFEALLRAGQAALPSEPGPAPEPELALELADTAIALRRKSRAAWQLKARALDALGRGTEAAAAFQAYVELGGRVEEPRTHAAEKQNCLDRAVALLPRGQLAAALRDQEPPARLSAAFAADTTGLLRSEGSAGARQFVELYATYVRLLAEPRMPDPLLGATEPIGVGDLRNRIAGRSIAVVADKSEVAGLEAYDVVVRCGFFPAGQRADVHVTDHRSTTCWNRAVTTRIVFGDPGEEWRQAVRAIMPDRQRFLGDASLRRPLSDPALIGERGHGEASAAFSLLRLLDFLDAGPRLDVYGLGALHRSERDWVAGRATDSNGTRATLR
ncbi:hypothetical protein [Streptomyces sp. KLOTTS4A1]|uniref:hypothetical protein n=1 Tax=Streptomyces sp. KLOTTS4A1 TaxID=3390996 RepID=UPI0039F5768C